MKRWPYVTLPDLMRGLYVLAYFKVDPTKVVEIEHDCQLSEEILRVLLIRKDSISDEEIGAETPAELAEVQAAESAAKAEVAAAEEAAKAEVAAAEEAAKAPEADTDKPTEEVAEALDDAAAVVHEAVVVEETVSAEQAAPVEDAPTSEEKPADE